MSRHTLGICWVQDEFYAVHLHKGQHLGRWEATTPVIGLDDFNQALADACKALAFGSGGDVSIVYESDLLAHSVLKAPPMNTRDMASFLERRVRQEKLFTEDAAWSYTRILSSREGEGVLLHLLPVEFRDAVIRICEEFQLYPVTLLPLSDAMAVHVCGLPVEDDAVVLLVAQFLGQCELLAVQGDGTVLFVRDLGYGWSGNEDRLSMEIERSLLYARQRFSQEISHVWVTGLQSESSVLNLKEKLSVPVTASEGEGDAFDWAFATGKLRSHSNSNLIPRIVSRKRIQRQMVRVSMALTFLLIGFSILTVWQVERMVAEQAELATSVVPRIEQLQLEKERWRYKVEAHQVTRTQLRGFTAASVPATVPAWFARYLATILPTELLLTRVYIALQSTEHGASANTWKFEIQGVEHGKYGNQLPMLLKAFESALITQPLHAKVTQSWRELWLRQIRQGSTDNDGSRVFTIKGVIHE